MRRLAVQDDDALDASLDRVDAGLDLRDHAAGDRAVLDQRPGLFDGQFLDQVLVLVEHAGNVGEEQQPGGVKGTCNGAGESVGIDVVGLAGPSGRDRCDHRDHLRLGEQVEQRAIDLDHFADEAQIQNALDVGIGIDDRLLRLLGKDHVAVLAAEADRPFPGLVDQGDDLLVDRAGQHHLDDLDRLLVGHAKTALEFRFDSHLGQHRADLRSAAVDHDRIDAGLLEKRDIGGEGLAQIGVAHGVAAVFHHDRLVFVALHEGQRLGKQSGLGFALGTGHGRILVLAGGLLAQRRGGGNNAM